MNIGNLYKVKKWSWLLFPTKETATVLSPDELYRSTAHRALDVIAAWYSRRFNCEVTYFSPDSYIVFLEEDGLFKKVLTSDGKIGWTWFTENYNDCFEILDFEK